MSPKKSEPPFAGEVFLRLWVTVPLESKTWEGALKEVNELKLNDIRLVPDNDVIDSRFETVAVTKRSVIAGGL